MLKINEATAPKRPPVRLRNREAKRSRAARTARSSADAALVVHSERYRSLAISVGQNKVGNFEFSISRQGKHVGWSLVLVDIAPSLESAIERARHAIDTYIR